MAKYIVLLGPPGAGKGTQADFLAKKTKLAHISSGDLFRENFKKETELGKLAKSFMDKGELVPDNVTIDMIRERLSRADCKEGAILDGFPRTAAQADALEIMLTDFHGQVDLVPYITADQEILIERASGRWVCRANNAHIYHQLFNKPRQAGICDVDNAELVQRDDDKVETVAHRIKVYLEQTAPLVKYYRDHNKLFEIDGTQQVEVVSAMLLTRIQK